MKLETIMTSQVKSITPEMTVRDAVVLLTSNKISGAPVIDQQQNVLSVVSEGDLLKLAAAGNMEKTIASCLEKLVKTSKLVTMKKTNTFADAYRMFLTHSVHRIIVTDSNGRLQGIVSRSNILRVLAETKTDAKPEQKADEKADGKAAAS